MSNDDTTITGQKDPSTGLYYIDLHESPPVAPQALHPFACSANKMKTKAELVEHLHRCAFSPVVHTWTKAIDAGYFATWPGLTSKMVRKHLPKLLVAAKGHLKQDGQNIRSTKPSIATAPLVLPNQHAHPFRSHQVFVQTVELTGKVSTDQTGRFTVTSSRGSKYLMVLYDHDSNAIIPEPIKSRSESEIIRSHAVLHSKLTNWGLRLTVTYSRLVASVRPHKTKMHRVHVTVGGNRLEFPGDTTANCARSTTTKHLLNSTISNPCARFITLTMTATR